MLIVVTAAVTEPVTLAEAKAQVRVTDTSEDALLGSLITAARETVEQGTGRALAAATYRWASTDDVMEVMRLPLWPVEAVTSVTYKDADGATQTMDSGDYTLDGDRATLTIDTMPDFIENLSVTFTTSPSNVPQAAKQAVLLAVADLYASRESVSGESAENPAIERLLSLIRVNYGV